jgi:hypothetical protein
MVSNGGKSYYKTTITVIGKTGINYGTCQYKFKTLDVEKYLKRVKADFARRGELVKFGKVERVEVA